MMESLELYLECHEGPLGTLQLVTDLEEGVYLVKWDELSGRFLEGLKKQQKLSVTLEERQEPSRLYHALDAYFSGDMDAFQGLQVHLFGSPFQKKVWEALKSIPAAETISYGEQAKRIHAPKAVRALGAANGKNPISLLLPCHRVVGKNGSLTGYAGGLERKRWLLSHEQKSMEFKLI